MPRTGLNPVKLAKSKLEPKTNNITITTVVHVPILEGYWEQSLEILALFFDSLYTSTSLPFDLMVFDNNSCEAVQDYLLRQKREGKIQYLVLSEYNLKKLGAMNYLFSAAQGEYVAWADSDVYFLPGWLEESIKILEVFPEAGQVSAIPTIYSRKKSMGQTLKGIERDKTLIVETGNDLVPRKYIEAHRLSLGKNLERSPDDEKRKDVRITRNGVSAFATSQDFQFITRRSVIREVLPLEVTDESEYFDSIYSPVFEAKIDYLGYWRLATTDYLVHHMGNRVPDLQKELDGIWSFTKTQSTDNRTGSEGQKQINTKPGTRNPFVRRFLEKVYVWTYKMLFEK